jgi:hypothetical protein
MSAFDVEFAHQVPTWIVPMFATIPGEHLPEIAGAASAPPAPATMLVFSAANSNMRRHTTPSFYCRDAAIRATLNAHAMKPEYRQRIAGCFIY